MSDNRDKATILAEMDKAAVAAEIDLQSKLITFTPEEIQGIEKFALWWETWYITAGYKRLSHIMREKFLR